MPGPNAAGGVSGRWGGSVSMDRRETYEIQVDDTVEDCFGHLDIVEAEIYAHNGDASGGVLTDPSAAVYLGRTVVTLPQLREDAQTPYIIPATTRRDLQSARMYVRGKVGDKVTIIYRQ